MSFAITPFYAALLTFIYLALSVRVIRRRQSTRIAIGHNDDRLLLRRMRVHANFAEYVPLAILLIAMAELLGAVGWLLHGLGLALLVGRCLHAYGVSQQPEPLPVRISGMVLTFIVLTLAALANLNLAIANGAL
ncbi:MAPEG family protein [Roseibium sp. RKSG952]|uniref:MAPEG family protein n=1 Tax=Roseibium sp. RKSG952 TaxID=2529384 RepID=UPI0012BC4823|nr:MAPEG family protein [Roseibium sp. RKSG952]MTH94802.1 glutathione metabolism protein [Roseibium sp. RKSG952]